MLRMVYSDKDFPDLLSDHLGKMDERNQAWLARKLNVSASTITRWLNGAQRPKNVEVIRKLQKHLNLSAEQANELAMAAGLPLLYLENHASGHLLAPDFSRRTEFANVNSVEDIIYKLLHWKEVHHAAQDLLVSLLILERRIKRAEIGFQNLNFGNTNFTIFHLRLEKDIKDVDDFWRSHCIHKANNLKILFEKLNLTHPKIKDLHNALLIDGEKSIYPKIQNLNHKSDETLNDLTISYEHLKELLINVLDVADIYIMGSAQELSEMNLKHTNHD